MQLKRFVMIFVSKSIAFIHVGNMSSRLCQESEANASDSWQSLEMFYEIDRTLTIINYHLGLSAEISTLPLSTVNGWWTIAYHGG